MTSNSRKLDALRQRAERIIENRERQISESDAVNLKQLLYELEVHQAELEIQNEELKRTQTALERSRDDFFRLFEFAPDGYVVLNDGGRIQRANLTFARMIGRDKADVLDQHFAHFVWEADRSVFYGRFRAFFNHPAGKHLEVRLHGRGSEPVFARIHGSAEPLQTASDDSPRLLLASVSDISAWKAAEARTKRAEKNLQSIIDRTPVGMCITNEHGIYEFVNSAYCQIYGYSPEELIGRHFTEVVPEARKAELSVLHDRFINNQGEIRGEWAVRDQAGRPLTVLADAAWILGADHRPKKATFVVDITARKEMERDLEAARRTLEAKVRERTLELEEKRARLAEAQHLARMGSWEWRIAEDRISWSDEVFRIFGLDPAEFDPTYENYIGSVHPEDRDRVRRTVTEAVTDNRSYRIEHRIQTPAGEVKNVYGEGRIKVDSTGRPVRLFGIVQDITEKKQHLAEIKRLSRAIEASTNLIFITDPQGKIEFVNRAFESVTGYSREEAIGQTPRILSSARTSTETYADLWETISAGTVWTGDFMNRRKNGQPFWVKCYILPIRGDAGEIDQFMAIQEDITQEIIASKKARYLADRDVTTGLLNRKTFIGKVERQLSEARDAALILFDLDGFKSINTIYGANLADSLLRQVARMIRSGLSADPGRIQYVGRFGEDELAVFLAGAGAGEALALAETIRKKIAHGTHTPEAVRVTVSAGVVAFPDHSDNTQDLLSKLLLSVQRAKSLGKNRCHIYEDADQELESRHRDYRHKEWILSALEEDRFEIWFQPILDLHTKTIHHFEVLVRMRNPDGSITLPGAFIPAAESMGLISDIDRMVIAKTVDYQCRLQRACRNYTLSINLSGKEIGDQQLIQDLRNRVRRTGINPGKLVFEITETAAITDLDKAVRFVDELREIGFRFSLDDFGVGFTSFIYLREMAVDYLKIDGVFIRRLHESREDQGIVQAITAVARGFGIKTIAEFVEHPETLERLEALHVDYAQGFLIGKPAPEPHCGGRPDRTGRT